MSHIQKNIVYVLLPEDEYSKLSDMVDKIYDHLSETSTEEQPLGEYITEKKAQALLDRKTTWFWARTVARPM